MFPLELKEVPAKLLDYFLRRNKSNINQYAVPTSIEENDFS